jgi:hypothetical protein
MAKNVAARKATAWLVVSTAPDVCKTPMGKSKPPVPYPVVARLQQAVAEVPTVRANGEPMVVFNHSYIPQTLGDEPGSAKGVKSGTVGANCYPIDHSASVRLANHYILRHDDQFWMNGA